MTPFSRRLAAPALLLAIAAGSLGAAVLRSGATPAQRVSYDIELKSTGIGNMLGHLSTAVGCTVPVNPSGYDLMVGTLTGNEKPGIAEDVVYYGELTRTTRMDFCEIRSTGPREDQKADCRVTLVGSATMQVELRVVGDREQGAWLTAKPKIGAAQSSVVAGTCDPPEMAQIKNDYPGPGSSSGGGASPDGQQIEDRFSTTAPNKAPPPGGGPKFFFGGQTSLKVGHYPANPAAPGGWALHVKRRIP